ncbi:MAG TPA: hypothetical protein VIG24_08300 [Acidimicrobiia bacterium]
MEWATAILGMALGALFGWSLAGWLEGREQAKIRDFYADLDEVRRRRNGGGA